MEIYIMAGIVGIGCVFAVASYFRRLHRGESCCGTQGEAPPKVKVTDRNKENYTYSLQEGHAAVKR